MNCLKECIFCCIYNVRRGVTSVGAVKGIDRDNIVTSGDGELSIATMVGRSSFTEHHSHEPRHKCHAELRRAGQRQGGES